MYEPPFRARRLVVSGALAAFLMLAACGGDAPPTSAAPGTTPANTATPPATGAPLLQKTQLADWCQEHGVPESVCTRCNAELIPGFKAKGDWCKQHELPDSQCIACHPEHEAKLKALAPKAGK